MRASFLLLWLVQCYYQINPHNEKVLNTAHKLSNANEEYLY